MRFRTGQKRKFALFFIRLSYRDHDFSPILHGICSRDAQGVRTHQCQFGNLTARSSPRRCAERSGRAWATEPKPGSALPAFKLSRDQAQQTNGPGLRPAKPTNQPTDWRGIITGKWWSSSRERGFLTESL